MLCTVAKLQVHSLFTNTITELVSHCNSHFNNNYTSTEEGGQTQPQNAPATIALFRRRKIHSWQPQLHLYTQGCTILDAMSQWKPEFVWWRLILFESSPQKLLRIIFRAATFVWKNLCILQFIYSATKLLVIILSFGATCLVWCK